MCNSLNLPFVKQISETCLLFNNTSQTCRLTNKSNLLIVQQKKSKTAVYLTKQVKPAVNLTEQVKPANCSTKQVKLDNFFHKTSQTWQLFNKTSQTCQSRDGSFINTSIVFNKISWLFLRALIVYTMVLCNCPFTRCGIMSCHIWRVSRNGISSGNGRN